MIKAIIFDCFGVLLVDKLKVLLDEVRLADPVKGQELTDVLAANHRGLLSSLETYAVLARGMGYETVEFQRLLREGESKNEPLLAYIVALQKKYKTGILSNIGRESLQKRFHKDELQAHFDAVVVSGEIGYIKPEPQAYTIAAERLGVHLSECVFIDDRESHCGAAQGVGMQAIVYTDFVQFKRDLMNLLDQDSLLKPSLCGK